MSSILPDHVIYYDVLTRLPVKSLLRFKSVCKYWYNLINSSTFLDIYRKYAIESRDYCHSSDDLLIVDYMNVFENNCDQFCLSYFYGPKFSREISVKFDTQFDFRRSWISEFSCYNGVICLRLHHDDFALCNPITRECRKIISPHCYYKYPLRDCNYGFGYDSVSDDYKIILIPSAGDVAQIYSARANSWKNGNKICPTVRYIRQQGTCALNNKLHYISCSRARPLRITVKVTMPYWMRAFTNIYSSIFTIDLHTEKFKSMELPVELTEYVAKDCRLISCNGRLYFSMSDINSLQATIWVMKEYGVTESWTKLYDLEGDIVKSRIISYNLSKVGAQVLVIKPVDEESDELVWYNFEDKSFRKVNVPGKRKYNTNRCLSMTGSLAPILGSTTTTQAEE